MNNEFFPPRPEANPTIYAYELVGVETHKGLLKVGFTNRNSKDRIAEQLRTSRVKYKIVLEESAMRNDGSAFTDFDVHRYLRKRGVKNPEGEWFKCALADVKAAVIAIKSGELNEENRTLDFAMRPEQQESVEKTARYFQSAIKEDPERTPHFLWNAKMRFGPKIAACRWRTVMLLRASFS